MQDCLDNREGVCGRSICNLGPHTTGLSSKASDSALEVALPGKNLQNQEITIKESMDDQISLIT